MGVVLPSGAADLATVEAERLLGRDDDATQASAYVVRRVGVGGVVRDSLSGSTAAVGVPTAAMAQALQAFGAAIDVERDVATGDRFFVRYEQTFTRDGHPVGIGRVLWAELHLAKGTIGIHRFRPLTGPGAGIERFWLAGGQDTTPPAIRLPFEPLVISSAFGMRADPFDQPSARGVALGPLYGRGPPSGLKQAGAMERVNVATPLGISLGLSPAGAARQARRGATVMHEGVDFAVPADSPVLAAADGTVIGAGPNGGYGNWIRIDHGGKIATVYGHLSAIAPGIEADTKVARGELIGFAGSTGRSTGVHLHFELLDDGKPVDPINRPETKRSLLHGPELDRFRKQVAQSIAERDYEAAVIASNGP
jgi:murein DD-endopeptidase MepM/ murein hydrolase activator NlpD